MFNAEFLGKSLKVGCYFLTGTGRCGTMLISKILDLGKNTRCYHEHSIKYDKMKSSYLSNDYKSLYEEIDTVINPLVSELNQKKMSYGESSGLIYLAFEELYRRYGKKARFLLLTRHPEGFVQSALARGFFDPDHPYPLEHVRARPSSEIGSRWDEISPFEKCLWYWYFVNSMIYNLFLKMPEKLWKIQPIETLDIISCKNLYKFMAIEGFEDRKKEIQELLSVRINASPGLGDNSSLNPWSVQMSLGDISTWEPDQKQIYEKWTTHLRKLLYPKD